MISLFLVVVIFAIIWAIVGALFLAFLFYFGIGMAILSLLQALFGLLVKGITGKRPEWLFSKSSFIVEIVLIAVLFVAYVSLPAHPIKVDADQCATVYTASSTLDPDSAELKLSHQENIAQLVEQLESVKVSRMLPASVKYAYTNAETGRKFRFWYFYDESGALLQKVCMYDDIIGVSSKRDGDFTYYNAKSEILLDTDPIYWSESALVAEETNHEAFEALTESMSYEGDGVYAFMVPEFNADSWNLKIQGHVRVRIADPSYASGYTNKFDTRYYLTEHTEARDWVPGQRYTFQLDKTTYDLITCTVTIGYSDFSFPFPLTDETYMVTEK